MTWLVVPITKAELAGLTGAPEGHVPHALEAIVRGRRFLVRAMPSGGALSAWWRKDGFTIGPHD